MFNPYSNLLAGNTYHMIQNIDPTITWGQGKLQEFLNEIIRNYIHQFVVGGTVPGRVASEVIVTLQMLLSAHLVAGCITSKMSLKEMLKASDNSYQIVREHMEKHYKRVKKK